MRLRAFEQKDIPFILEWMTSPDVNCFFRFDPNTVDERTVARFVASARAGVTALRPLLAGIDGVPDDCQCGSCGGQEMPDKSAHSSAADTDGAPPLGDAARSAGSTPPSLHLACVNDADEYLGTVSLKEIDFTDGAADFAISFRASARGTGAAAFATREILRLAFGPLGLSRVYLNVLADNTRARAFYEKHGFVYEGTFRRHLILRGSARDLCWYGILKEEFAE